MKNHQKVQELKKGRYAFVNFTLLTNEIFVVFLF